MIADRTSSGVVVSSTMQGEVYQAGIDDDDMPHLIRLFTDLYSDTELACLREYSTNARDAQIEAGVNRPIEINLPSALAPFLTIRDFGVGLDADTIRLVYSRYGRSTKRDSNDFNGMLGLGCKSALTYAQSFTVESVKDGMKTLCSITRVENGVPSFQVVSSLPTDDPNGTVVRIPARRHNDFERKAKGLYRFWPEGSVLVDGREPEKFKGLDLGTKTLTVEWDTYSMEIETRIQVTSRAGQNIPSQSVVNVDLVVMGGVPYPAPNLGSCVPYGRYVVATVDIGAVDFPPSREALMTTPKTTAVVEAITTATKQALFETVQKLVDSASSPREAIRIAAQNADLLGSHHKDLKFNGKGIPSALPGVFIYSSPGSSRPGASSTTNGLAMSSAVDALFVTGFEPKKFSAPHKYRLNKFCDDNGIDRPSVYVMTPSTTVDLDWLDASQLIKWEDVRAVKLPRASRGSSGKPLGAYDVLIPSSSARASHVQGEDIRKSVAAGTDLFHHYGTTSGAHALSSLLEHFYPGCILTCLPDNRVRKYERLFPESRGGREAVHAKYQEWVQGLSNDQRVALHIQDSRLVETFSGIDPLKVDDPEVRRAIRLVRKIDLTAPNESRRLFSSVIGHYDPEVTWENPLEKYLLLFDRYGRNISPDHPHFYIYLNAAYAASKEQS